MFARQGVPNVHEISIGIEGRITPEHLVEFLRDRPVETRDEVLEDLAFWINAHFHICISGDGAMNNRALHDDLWTEDEMLRVNGFGGHIITITGRQMDVVPNFTIE
jgi:hypothetical protein